MTYSCWLAFLLPGTDVSSIFIECNICIKIFFSTLNQSLRLRVHRARDHNCDGGRLDYRCDARRVGRGLRPGCVPKGVAWNACCWLRPARPRLQIGFQTEYRCFLLHCSYGRKWHFSDLGKCPT